MGQGSSAGTTTAVMPKTKYRKIESYMERLFERDMALRPLVAASMTMKYMHINPKMKPFIIRTAQRAKDRVRKRIKDIESLNNYVNKMRDELQGRF